MPKINDFEGKIPVFYRKRTIEVLMFGHVTALHERCMKIDDNEEERKKFMLRDAIEDFLDLYGIDEDEYPVESALIMYNRMLNNYIYVKKIFPNQTNDGVDIQNQKRY